MKKFLSIAILSCGIYAFYQNRLSAEDKHNSPLNEVLGGTYKVNTEASTPYLAVGCLDHRTLMFIVHEIEGTDPKIAHMLAERDCRPLMKDTEYLRCGGSGYAHPNKGEPLTYSAYCRKGAKDLQLYILDIQLSKIK